MIPCTWCSGSVSSRRSDGAIPTPRPATRSGRRSFSWVETTPFRAAGRPAGVDDHRAAVRAEVRQMSPAGEPAAAPARRRPGARARRAPAAPSIGARGRIADDDRRAGVADDVVELGRRMRDRQRHGHAARAPDATLHGGVGEAGRHEERHARLLEIVVVAEQRAGDAARRVVELLIGVGAIDGDDGRPRNGVGGHFERTVPCLSSRRSAKVSSKNDPRPHNLPYATHRTGQEGARVYAQGPARRRRTAGGLSSAGR